MRDLDCEFSYNAEWDCDMAASTALVDSVFHRVLKAFPPVRFAFAYGSNVFQQLRNPTNQPGSMIDFIFAVDDPVQWHAHNIAENGHHYSVLSMFGPQMVSIYQDMGGAKMYFNALVPFEETYIKYGVISTKTLAVDLLDWNTLYVSGRLHKPVQYLHTPTDRMRIALRHNLESALHTALLMLPETFTEEELYSVICGLSYTGDFRMTFGEDKGKVQNIVGAQMPQFRKLYQPIIASMSNYVELDYTKSLGIQDVEPHARMFHLNLLPETLQSKIVHEYSKHGKSPDVEEVFWSLAHDADVADVVQHSLANIVWSASIQQSIKNIFSAGIPKAVRYSIQKIKKMYRGGPKKE